MFMYIRVSRIGAAVLGLTIIGGCVGGRVLYADGSPVAGVQVDIRECEGCAAVSVVTNSSGVYQHDPYVSGNQLSNNEDGLIITVQAKHWVTTEGPPKFRRDYCNSTESVVVSHLPTWQYDASSGKQYTIVPDIYIATQKTQMDSANCPEDHPYRENFPADNDRDGLANVVESVYGTNPSDSDTDDDGLSDGIEVRGAEAIYRRSSSKFAWKRQGWTVKSDVAARGASPLRRNAFIEVDYWEDNSFTMRPSSALQNMISAHFAGLNGLVNPDGSRGMDVLLYIDQEVSTLTNCSGPQLNNDAWAQFRGSRREGVFTHGLFCGNGGIGGAGFVPGGSFFVRGRTDLNSSNDMIEEAQNELFSSFLHEFGHTLGLGHGGNEGLNCKPNYPSDMNYAYFPSFGLDGDNYSLQTSQSQYSTGGLADINENSVSEFDPLNAPFGTVGFLEVFGGTTARSYLTRRSGNGNTDVDWDRDLAFNSGTPPAPVRTGGDSSCNDTTFRTIKDSDDEATIRARLGQGRLGRHSAAAAGGDSQEAGGQAVECGSEDISGDYSTAPSYERPWIHAEARQRLGALTGLGGERLRSWATNAGFDVAKRTDVRLIEKLLDRSARGRAAKALLETADRGRSTTWLSRAQAEREAIERSEELLRELFGRRIDLSFVDCRMRSETIRSLLVGGHEGAMLNTAYDEVDQIKICR